MDNLVGIPVAWLTPGALVGIAVWFIFTGRLLPRSTVTDYIRRIDKLESALDKAMDQNTQLLENSRVFNEFMQRFPRPKDGAD